MTNQNQGNENRGNNPSEEDRRRSGQSTAAMQDRDEQGQFTDEENEGARSEERGAPQKGGQEGSRGGS